MDCMTPICEADTVTTEPSAEYVAAARAYARSVEAMKAKREALLPLLLDEVRRGALLSRLAKESGYTAQHIARLARDAGIEPRVDREPPRRPKPTDAES
jgi:DNA-binding phage protein